MAKLYKFSNISKFSDIVETFTFRIITINQRSGPVFTKGLRLRQVLDLNVVLKLRLLSQLSFVLKSDSQKVT